jgi:hypothetical protein
LRVDGERRRSGSFTRRRAAGAPAELGELAIIAVAAASDIRAPMVVPEIGQPHAGSTDLRHGARLSSASCPGRYATRLQTLRRAQGVDGAVAAGIPAAGLREGHDRTRPKRRGVRPVHRERHLGGLPDSRCVAHVDDLKSNDCVTRSPVEGVVDAGGRLADRIALSPARLRTGRQDLC